MASITVDRSINADDAFAMSAGIAFVALPSGSATYQTQATGITTWATATIVQSSAWQAVCYGNNLVVAVSSTSGTIAASSPAGASATWTLRTMPATASWYAVKYGLDRFVSTAGGGSTAGAYSLDGAKWTSMSALPVSGDWRALEFGGSRFVAVSYGSTDSAYSTNGTSWTAGGALPASRNWTDMVYGESTFVAIASGTDKGAYSTDGGVTWQEMTMPSSSNWRSITYGNGTFVAVSNTSGTIAASSPDGITWTPRTLPATAAWVGVAFGNNLFTAVSTSSTNAATSPDGFNWDAIAQLSQAVSCIAYTPTTWNSNDTLVITNNATVTVNTDQKKFWNAITLTNGKLHITNNSTSTGIRFTMGRVSGAAQAAITPGSGIGDIEITGNWIELGTGDGTSGQEMTAPFTDYIAALWVETASGSGVYEMWLNATGAYGDTAPLLTNGLSAVGKEARGKFFIQQAASSPYGPTTINCTDGSLAQKLLTVTSSTGLYAGASVFGPVGIPANTVVNRVISSTLIELNASTTTEISPDWSSVAYGNSTYVAVSRGYSNVAATSSDGATWTKRTLPFIADWTSVTYGATSALFVAVASHGAYGMGYCATSADGITWTQRAMPSVMNWTSVASNGTSFVAVGQTAANAATTAAASSTNGITWVAATMATSQIWNAVAYGGSRYVAVGTGTATNYDADGAGTWTNGAALSTSATYTALAYNGSSLWVVVSGSTSGSQSKADPTSGTFAAGGALPNNFSRGIAWDGTNFVVVSTSATTTGSSQTARSTNAAAWTTTTLTGTQIGNWMTVCANGTTLVAMSNSSVNRSYAMTSTDSGATWTVRAGTPLDVSLTCFNPYVSQLTNTVEFGDNINGNKVPSGAKVRCPNIMFTADTPANIQTVSRLVGANMVMSNGGALAASICLFDESYNSFLQAESVSLTNVGFSLPPLLQECYGVVLNSVGFALEPVRRYYQFSATVGANGWFSRESRYGSGSTNAWNYINDATITDLNMAIGQPFALILSSGTGTVAAPNAALVVTNTENSTWTNIRFYGLHTVRNFQAALSLTSLFNNNTITNLESYSLSPFFLGVSNENTITNVTYSEDMFNGMKNFTTAARIGNDPIAGAHLVDDTKYYLKIRTFKDWTDRSVFTESRVYSATPYLGYKYHPQSLSVYNSAARAVTLTWVRREPTSAIVSYTIFRGTSPGFTRNSASRLFYSPTSTVVTYTNGYVAQATGSGGRTLTFAQAGRTITASSGSFITDGFLAGANVVVTGTTSNNGTFMILSLTATVITLTTNHTNLVNEGPISTGALNGQVPDNGSTYYYRLQKYEAANAGITNAAGTAAGTTLTIPSGSFDTGLGTIINCSGISGQNKVRIPNGSTTNFLAANVCPGMKISGGGVGASATIVSVDTPWQITLSVNNSSTFTGQTLSKGAAAGMYIYGPGIAWPTKVVSVDTTQQITVDTAFLATFSAQTINFMYGSESAEFEVYVNGPTAASFNYLLHSDDFSNAAWVKTNATVVVDQRIPPSQAPYAVAASITGVADRLTSNGPSGRVVQTVTDLESGVAYNFSVYVMTDSNSQIATVTGEIAINTTSPTTQAFTANGKWQRVAANFTATSASHTFTIQINTEGAYIYIGTANLVPGSGALAPITNTTVKKAAGSGGRTLTFASAGTVHTITASTGSFTTDGFVAGDSIIVAGTTSNDGQYVLATVAATVLTITPAQPLVAEGPISVGTITGSVLAAAAQELTLVAAWSRSLGGNATNQGIELTLATAPVNALYSEIYLGTASSFTPTDTNRVAYVGMLGSNAPISLSNASDNKINTFTQVGYGGLSGALLTLLGSSNNTFLDFTVDFNYAANTSMLLSSTALSNNNILDDFTIKNWRNYISAVTPFTFLNNASGVTLQNMTFNHYDIPFYTSATNSALGVIMKGVSGGNADAITTATTYALGSAVDGVGISFTAVYDTMFHELFTSPTTGALSMRFNASAQDSLPYATVSGSPAFSNTGRLYLRTAGDSIEFTWPHRIYTVSGFRDIPFKFSSLDLGNTASLDAAFSILVEYSIDTGSGYGAYQVATPAALAAEAVSTTTGFLLKLRLTARPGMMFSGQTNAFVVGETIRGALSGVTAVVDELYQLTTTTGTIILSSVSGTFIATENIVRDSDSQTRATNVVTNTQFATFPSFNSYIDGLEIFTNTVGPGDYPGQIVNIVLTNVVAGSRYYVYRTSDLLLLGSGEAATSTVTIPNVAYTADFGITIRVRKASAAPKYVPLETQATVNSAGASVYIGQQEDTITS